MGKIADDREPFEIRINIEDREERMLVIPDQEETRYEIFDEHTRLGAVWTDDAQQGRVWFGEGMVVKELLPLIGEQIDNYLNNKPV